MNQLANEEELKIWLEEGKRDYQLKYANNLKLIAATKFVSFAS
jgi:hypothetical protein